MDEITELALAAQRGDRVALAAFVRRTQPDVWRLCCHLAGRAAADDLTQETYLRALSALGRFRGESSARTWLLAIARRACVDSIRVAQRRRRLLRSLGAGRVEAHAPPSVGTDVLLACLDVDRRGAFFLTQLLGLTYAEAADVCGVPVGTIRSRVARARDQLIGEWSAEAAE